MQRMDENSAMDRKQIFSQQRRVTVTLFIVLACFVLCWLPYCVYANYVTFVTDKQSIPAWANGVVSHTSIYLTMYYLDSEGIGQIYVTCILLADSEIFIFNQL